MSVELSQVIEELREDHGNLRLLLDLLESESDTVTVDDEPDFELLHDIMQYMTVYSDAVHHPKEDVVYEKLRSKRPDLSEDLAHVPDDHRRIAELGLLLRSDVEAINAGAAVRREKMIEDTRAYITCLREHMTWEEEDLFRRIDLMLDAEPYKVDVSSIEHIKDPVFELEIEAGFRRLMDSLAA